MCDHDHLAATGNQALRELVHVVLHSSKVGVEEVSDHGNAHGEPEAGLTMELLPLIATEYKPFYNKKWESLK
jgi:hypothetical protein